MNTIETTTTKAPRVRKLSNKAILAKVQAELLGRGMRQLHMYHGHAVDTLCDSERKPMNCSNDVYEAIKPFYGAGMTHREELWIVYLDRGCKTLGCTKISEGGMHGTVADPKLIFAAALVAQASSIVVTHNHPSGQLRPSEEDIRLTRKLVEGGRLLDIQIHDHVIVTDAGYYSFADNGMLH